jgi:LPXTG-site transpeptidase (sortase) family protein
MMVRIKGRAGAGLPRALNAAHRITLWAGVGLVAWPVFVFAQSAYAQWSGERELAFSLQAAQDARETVVAPRRPAQPAKHARGSVLGRFEAPRLKLSYVVLEGTDNPTLDRSIGHVEGTGAIGEAGNIAIAGHRNTHFRKLEWIRRGDDIVLTSPQGTFRYKVEWTRLFGPRDVDVLDASHGPAVTLVTCFPFEYVGSAPLRFIVRALPVEETRARLGTPARSGHRPGE